MATILEYSLKVALATAAFYTFWRLLLSKDTFHGLNRIVLTLTPLVSLILPFCVVTIHKTEVLDLLPSDVLNSEAAAGAAGQTSSTWVFIILGLYLAGVMTVIMKTAVSALKIIRIIRSGSKRVEEDGTVIVSVPEDIPPFSWMGHIVLSKADADAACPEVITHEKAHLRLHHSLDILLVDLLSSVQWYNPMIWMLRSDLRGIHEYEADSEVLRQGIDANRYQLFLIRKAAASRGYTIANSIQSGTLRDRITMMSRKRSSKRNALKVLYVIPIIAISLAATAKTVTSYEASSPAGTEVSSPAPVPFQLAEVKPRFGIGDANEFSRWVNSKLVYPQEAKDQGIAGKVIVNFTINEHGDLIGPKVLRGVHPLLDGEALRVISMSPRWTPGQADGKAIAVTYTFPVIFQLR